MLPMIQHTVRFCREAVDFLRHLNAHRYLIYELTKRDFATRYVENIFGLAWAILDPLAFMLILWVVFAVGFRSGTDLGVPFVAYIVTGLSCYTFFAETIAQATGSILSYSFLLQKVNFRISMLPIVKILSGLFVHWIVIVIVVVILLVSGVRPSIYWIQIFYYQFCLFCMLVGIVWFTSSVNVFFRDISNIVLICTRFLFYLTPVFWHISMFPKKYHIFFVLNPLFYLVSGYRDSFLFHRWFWEHPYQTIYFWFVALFFLLVGISVFSRLKPHFADVV